MYVTEADEPRFKVAMAILTIFGHFWTNFSAIKSKFKDMGKKIKVGPLDSYRCPVMGTD